MGLGSLGRGGARRRTRRRWIAMSAMLSTKNKAEIEQATGKKLDDLSDEELEAEMKKRGITPPPPGPDD
ncbi:hypothetical protein [Methanogenium sp. MK-MG]|uniref:hypothetical protein n=1 Tax=Methanogenium sp. MK-MG TaxID=2599926 RepID=UPI0013EC73B2|nr:hypothetical protein [Methanogenium sp. MK-MG]KAF1078530.1 hypothetical protein MKMG_00587 [Methanogenium sp. MK-MG]